VRALEIEGEMGGSNGTEQDFLKTERHVIFSAHQYQQNKMETERQWSIF
jgi:hypothetical protein